MVTYVCLLLLLSRLPATLAWWADSSQLELLKEKMEQLEATNALLLKRLEAVEMAAVEKTAVKCVAQDDKFDRLLTALVQSHASSSNAEVGRRIPARRLQESGGLTRMRSDTAALTLMENYGQASFSLYHDDDGQTGVDLSTGMRVEGTVALGGQNSTFSWQVNENVTRSVRQLDNELADKWPAYKSEVAYASSVCMSAVTRGAASSFYSVITVPYNFSNSLEPAFYGNDIDSECHSEINGGWHACGVVKDQYIGQGCQATFGGHTGSYDNHGGSYTSFIPRERVVSGDWNNGDPECSGPHAVFICCSPQCPNPSGTPVGIDTLRADLQALQEKVDSIHPVPPPASP